MSTYKLPGGEIETKSVVASSIAMTLLEAFPRPKPPVVLVDYGDGKKVAETNHADPDYASRVIPEYEASLELKRVNLILKRGVVKRPLTEAEQNAVNDVRADFLEEGITLQDGDWSIWLKHVACHSDADLVGLIRHISEQSNPLDGAREVADGFRGDVSES